jgi:hypothetical protein
LSNEAWSDLTRLWLSGALALGALVGCLPKDTRPPPAHLMFTASPSESIASPDTVTQTEDGWELSFSRVLVTVGRVSLDGDRCNDYSDARYSRVLSLIGAPANEKISESFGLGHCDFAFSLLNAESDSLLGSLTTADDVAFLRTPGEDKYAGPSGVSLYVEGKAVRGEERKDFAWKFRARVRFGECADVVDGMELPGLELAENGAVNVDVVLAPEAVFGDNVDPSLAKLRFDAIADADTVAGNGDGEVTLDELSLVPFVGLQDSEAYAAGDAGVLFMTLEDFVYLGAAPGVARYRGTGKCKPQLRPVRGGAF